jgi:transposase
VTPYPTPGWASPRLNTVKALASLDREWDGLIARREFPMISLDNNAAERALPRPVVTRKNAYGSRNDDAARLAARIWTITATAEMAGLNVLTYLAAYPTPADAAAASRSPGGNRDDSCLDRRPADLRTAAHASHQDRYSAGGRAGGPA